MRAVRKHTDCPWALLYIERWLAAPVQLPDGSLTQPEKGVPQGAVISPVLSNLFLHYALDVWMVRYQADIRFERYADDVLCHCTNRGQAERLKVALTQRWADCGLEVHPQKTHIVYCKDTLRRGPYPEHQFDFLGFVRHEVAYTAVMTTRIGHNLVCCHQYPTRPCGWSNSAV